jgi:hypothetical protein
MEDTKNVTVEWIYWHPSLAFVSLEVQGYEWLEAIRFERKGGDDLRTDILLAESANDGWVYGCRKVIPKVRTWTEQLFDAHKNERQKAFDNPVKLHELPNAENKRLTRSAVRKVGTPTDTLIDFIDGAKPKIIEHLSSLDERWDRVNWLRIGLDHPDDPTGPFYRYVDQVIPEGVSNEFRDKLARRLFQAWDDFKACIEKELASFDEEQLQKRAGITSYFDEDLKLESRHRRWPSDGMLWLDKVGLEWLDKWTDAPVDESSFEQARSRWENKRGTLELLKLWVAPTDDIPLKLWPVERVAEHLWNHEIRPQWERLRDNRPAVVRAVHDDLEEMAFRNGRTVREQDGPQLELWNDGDELVAQTPTLAEQQLAQVVEQGTEEFRSITGVRLLVHVIRTTHLQFYRGVDDPRVVEIEGGIKELSRQIGGPGSGKSQDRLRKILEAGSQWRKEWNGVIERGLWTWRVDDRTGPGKRSHIRIIVGDPLSPQFVHKMPKGERTLVPIVDIAPLVNPGRYYGPQAAFQQAVVRKIVERRKHIPDRGGAALSLSDDLWPVADRLNLPQSTMKRALDRWTSDGDDGPKFLELVDGRLEGDAVYHLADNDKYRRAREFVAETARRSQRASEAGKASANKRKNR